jgi:DNA modification methylase
VQIDVWRVALSRSDVPHTAMFPVRLTEPCILAGCPPGGTVLDPFAGSRTTGEAALQLGRSAILIELNSEYVDIIKRRVSKGGISVAPA